MRVDDAILGTVCYMYASRDDALNGDRRGGTGFLVGVPIREDGPIDLYLVTNRHVLKKGYYSARLNRVDGTFEVIDTQAEWWSVPENGADVAIAAVHGPWHVVGGTFIPVSAILNRDQCAEMSIGVGDDVVMVSRLVHREGKVVNTPAVRFGAISMMPGEPIYSEDLDNDQVSFVMEMRSIAGHSGSPVWVSHRHHLHMIGIDWGHLYERTRSGAIENANMALVVPGWEILDLLYREDIVRRREEAVKEARIPRDEPEAVSDTEDRGTTGPAPERLAIDGTTEDVARRVFDAGKPDDDATED